jgi:hypothetical protein
MAGFADLVGRNSPALGFNKAAYVGGDTWGDTVGSFLDNSGYVINLANANIYINIYDKPGGNLLYGATATGTIFGTFSWFISNTVTASLEQGSRREVVWSAQMQQGGSTITVWSAVESSLTILSS